MPVDWQRFLALRAARLYGLPDGDWVCALEELVPPTGVLKNSDLDAQGETCGKYVFSLKLLLDQFPAQVRDAAGIGKPRTPYTLAAAIVLCEFVAGLRYPHVGWDSRRRRLPPPPSPPPPSPLPHPPPSPPPPPPPGEAVS